VSNAVLSFKDKFSNCNISPFKTGRKSQQIQSTDGDDNDDVSINQVIENR